MSAAAAQSPALAPYEAILAHAELELELAGRGELEPLAELGERWDSLIAGLPARPPAEASSLLTRAKLMHERTHIELMRLRERLLSEVSVASQAQRAADGYAPRLSSRLRLSRSA